ATCKSWPSASAAWSGCTSRATSWRGWRGSPRPSAKASRRGGRRCRARRAARGGWAGKWSPARSRGGCGGGVSAAAARRGGGRAKGGARGSRSLQHRGAKLQKPGAVWIMVPAGGPTEETVQALAALLEAGDTIIDGGNSFFKDDVRRAKEVAKKGIRYVDVGTSGGVWGVERGYCLMAGGTKEAIEHVQPVLQTLVPGK